MTTQLQTFCHHSTCWHLMAADITRYRKTLFAYMSVHYTAMHLRLLFIDAKLLPSPILYSLTLKVIAVTILLTKSTSYLTRLQPVVLASSMFGVVSNG